MRLRNKKTGEIGNLVFNINPNRESYSVLSTENGDTICGNLVIADYNSLAELEREWEDYEELEHYYIYHDGDVVRMSELISSDLRKNNIEIGNYFNTREEAEKAVEKLKAWKRLKDKGIEFYGWRKNQTGTYDFLARWEDIPPKMTDIIKDLDLLFGGEE